ncbi:hypothetical protein BS17DRAFT_883440 [Gyrodon lividus]|nr:hypothetical protein BS17DRAFT_883440 [Gyrodon lividus]
MVNPNTEICPDFTSRAFRAIREAVMAAENIDQDMAIEHLVVTWQDHNCLPPPNVLEERPSQYALSKLASFDFVPLWYFTFEGCRDAVAFLRSKADDAYGLTSANDVLTLKLVTSVKASKNVWPDELLSFSEFL